MKKLKNQYHNKKLICNAHKECPERFTCVHAKPHYKHQGCGLTGLDLSDYDSPKDHPCYYHITKNENRKMKIEKIENINND